MRPRALPSAGLVFLNVALFSPLVLAPVAQAQPSQADPAAPDPKDPAAPRDVSHYNLDDDALAIEGYDPVAYFPEGGGKPLKGDKKFQHTHRGVTYRFASAANLDRFKADPEKYEPAHGGWCSSAFADSGKKVEIDPKNFKVTDGRLFLFYKDIFSDARAWWVKDEPGHTVAADAAWKKISGEEPRVPEADAPR